MSALKPMRDYQPVTDADLARARHDGAFRQQMLANSLDRLLLALTRLRNDGSAINKARAEQMREGAQLAVKLAELLQAVARDLEDGER